MPYQDTSDYERIKRRREISRAMQERAMAPYETQMVSGRAVPFSFGKGLTDLASAYFGREGEEKADIEEAELKKTYGEGKMQAIQDALAMAEGQRAEIGTGRGALREIPPDPMGAIAGIMGGQHAGDLESVSDALLKQEFAKSKAVKPTYKVIPEMQPSGKWQNRAIVSGVPGELVGGQYAKGAGASEVSASAKAGGKGYNKYAEERMKGQAVQMDDLQKSARSAYNELQALDRFIKGAEAGTAGGAQPIISGMKNFLSSFGYTDESLVGVNTMKQAIGDMKINKIAEFGARGLTDKDMEVIHESLPRVATDPVSRVAIAKILKKLHDREIQDYEFALTEESRLHPDVAGQIRAPRWLSNYRSIKKDTQSNDFMKSLDEELGLQ